MNNISIKTYNAPPINTIESLRDAGGGNNGNKKDDKKNTHNASSYLCCHLCVINCNI